MVACTKSTILPGGSSTGSGGGVRSGTVEVSCAPGSCSAPVAPVFASMPALVPDELLGLLAVFGFAAGGGGGGAAATGAGGGGVAGGGAGGAGPSQRRARGGSRRGRASSRARPRQRSHPWRRERRRSRASRALSPAA